MGNRLLWESRAPAGRPWGARRGAQTLLGGLGAGWGFGNAWGDSVVLRVCEQEGSSWENLCEGVSLDTRPKWGLGSAMGGSVVFCACNQDVNSWEKLL